MLHERLHDSYKKGQTEVPQTAQPHQLQRTPTH